MTRRYDTLPDHEYRELIEKVAEDYPPITADILEAMVWVESGFDPEVESDSGAIGLTQVIPDYHERLIREVAKEHGFVGSLDDTLRQPDISLAVGARHLRWCRDECGSWAKAIAKYHSGVCAPEPDFVDGQGTPTVAHVAYFEEALATIEATRGRDEEPYVAPAVLKYLEDLPESVLTHREGRNLFFRIGAQVRATKRTRRYQRARQGGPETGPLMEKDEEGYAEWGWIEADGTPWLLSDWWTRFLAEDFARIDGKAIAPPDPDPVPTPSDPGIITAENYRDVEDPWDLLPPITWVGSPNFFPNRHGYDPVAIIYHITDDLNYANTRSWFSTPVSQASSQFVILRNGTVHQYVSSKDGSWTNGDVNGHRRDMPWLVNAVNRRENVNNYTISYEFVADRSTPVTEEQYVSAIKLSRYFCHPSVYDIPPHRGWQGRHSDINSVGRPYCPGDDFQLERIIRELGGDPAKMS